MPDLPYVDELVHRLSRGGGLLEVRPGGRGSVEVLFTEEGVDHPITLRTSEAELSTAVTALAETAHGAWPDDTAESAGFNLLLVHLDEVVATRDTSEPLRITADGLQWPPGHRW